MIKQVDKDNGFISLAVKRINPNAEFVIRENNLDKITWDDDTTPISKSDIETKIEDIKKINVSKPLKLDCGKTVNDFPLAYETYGKLNENKDNAILVFHALTGDQFVAGTNPVTNKEGWWVTAVGPGKAIDTNKIPITIPL